MSAIHVRNVPDEVVAALKRRAAREHRSLQKEVLHILTAAAREAPHAEPLPPITEALVLASDIAPSDDMWSREEIYGDDAR